MHSSSMRVTHITDIETQFEDDGTHILSFTETAHAGDKWIHSYLALYLDEEAARVLKYHVDQLVERIERRTDNENLSSIVASNNAGVAGPEPSGSTG